MAFKNRLKMRVKLLRFGALYTFTRTTEVDPTTPNPESQIDAAYKHKHKTTSTFTEQAFVRPARAYNIHSDTVVSTHEGGNEMSGIINIEVPYTTNVRIHDMITTPKGNYDIVAEEVYDEIRIFEAHKV